MNLDKYTQKSQEAILAAQRLAQDYNHQSIEPTHLLVALLLQDQGVVPAIVTRVAGSLAALRDELQDDLNNRPKISGANMDVGLSRPACHGRPRTRSRLQNATPKACKMITSRPSISCSG